jgi:3-phenylpropionate/trans-cinnamate dioxygenase ferredoxin subunit
MACPLEAGACDGFVITCPCHDWRFDVRTGAFVEAPEISIPTYPVRVAGGEVFVEL